VDPIDLSCPIIVMMTAETGHHFLLAGLGRRFSEYLAHGFTVLNTSNVIQCLMAEDNRGQRSCSQIFPNPTQLLGGNVSLVATALAAGVISIKNHDVYSFLVKGVVRVWHPQKSGCLLPRVSTIHIVVPEYMKSWSVECSPAFQESSIAIIGSAEIAKLANEVGLCLIHFFRKSADALASIMHDILMNIRNKPKPQRCLVLVRTKGNGRKEIGTVTERNCV